MKGRELYVICWKSNITGYAGRGSQTFSSYWADREIERLNKEFSELSHWKERV